jgi:hypothetical protein
MSDLNLKSFNPLYPMRIHQYDELFNDQNQNVMDKINSIIDYLNQVGKLTNDVVKDWNTVYQWVMNDGLTTDVNNKLEDMLAKGELNSIIDFLVSKMGDLTTLTTTDKTTIVNAINSLKSELTTAIGLKADEADLTALTTRVTSAETSLTQKAAQTDLTSLTTRVSNNETSLTQKMSQADGNQRGINAMFPPAPLVACKGDGTTDEGSAIQSLLNNYNHIIFPLGTYKVITPVSITNKSNIVIEGMGAVFTTGVNVNMFTFDTITGITIKNIEFNLTAQNGGALSNLTNIALQISNSFDVDVHNVYAHDGCEGIIIQRCERVKFYNNRIANFTWWGLTFGKADGGHLKKAEIYGNITTNYQDGLKFTGILEDVDVYGNLSYGNIQDGFDWAGHSALNVHIHDNIFRNNTANGITFKTLNDTTYPISSDYSGYTFVLKHITIENNELIQNTGDGVYMAYNAPSKRQQVRSIKVKNNKIKGNENATPISGHSGIECASFNTLASADDYFSIEDNIIMATGLYYGIRSIDSAFITIKRNKILSGNTAIYLQQQTGGTTCTGSIVRDNDIEVNYAGYGIYVDANNANALVTRNKIYAPSSTYRLQLAGTGFINTLNEIKDYNASTVPTGRATKGEIAYSSDPTVSNCMGWICTVTGSTSTWKTFGAVV